MRPVQSRASPRRRAPGSWCLTLLATALVLGTLVAPGRPQDVAPETFLRLPLEALVLLAVVVALPPRLRRVRVLLAAAAGAALGLSAVLKLLDLGFLESLNRPFDALVDWRYAGSLVETAQDSFGHGFGTALLVGAALVATALLVLLPLAVLRLTRALEPHRGAASRVVVALLSLWLVLAVLDVRTAGRPVATSDTSRYLYGQVSRIPAELRAQRGFERATTRDSLRRLDAREALAGLRGKDVLIVFVESFGRVAVEGASFSPEVRRVLDAGTARLREAGFASESAFLTSPTFGALSWLAHATLQSGLWVDSQRRYDVLVTGRRLTLSRLFGSAGWRTVADVPANTRDWPQGAFYGFDHLYDSRNVGYRGPRFGYPTMPDQYTLDAFHRLELAPEARSPVMAEIDLITSHAPWSRTPRLIDQADVGDGSVFDGMPAELPSERDIWPSPQRVRAAYGEAIEYSLSAFFTFMTTYGDDDLVVVLLGDHQPATIVSGSDAGHDVPVSVIAGDRAVLDRITPWGWTDGMRPHPGAPVWRMDEFRDRFVSAFGSTSETGHRDQYHEGGR